MIIKEKGKTKCFFYSDDKCRYGDRTRDCINCVRVTYHSLYSLNFDNQERLQKKIKHKEQECKKLKKELASFMNGDYCANGCSLKQQLDKLKQTLAEIKEIAEECYYKCNSMNNCNISCKYYNDCNGEFSYLLAYLNKQISEVEDEN